MEYKKLGLTDLKISRIGFGCWAIGGYGWGKVNDRDSIATIRKALDLGINFFDTADVYGFGYSEEILSKALGNQKKKVVIATKFGVKWDKSGRTDKDISSKRVVEALDGSLKRLKIDCIPLYQIHWPDFKTPISETMEALKKCQKAGKIKHIGCCNFSVDLIQEAQKISRIEALQAPYNIKEREIERELIHCCRKYKISIITYSTLLQGLFTGKYGRKSKFSKNDVRSRYENWVGEKFDKNLKIVEKLKKLSAFYKKTPAQIAIRWVLDNTNIASALVGVQKPEQIQENVDATGWKLSKEDRENLAKL